MLRLWAYQIFPPLSKPETGLLFIGCRYVISNCERVTRQIIYFSPPLAVFESVIDLESKTKLYANVNFYYSWFFFHTYLHPFTRDLSDRYLKYNYYETDIFRVWAVVRFLFHSNTERSVTKLRHWCVAM